MAPKGSVIEAALTRFGREVIVDARDTVISSHDALATKTRRIVPEHAAPEAKQMAADYAAVSSLSPELRAAIRRFVIRAADDAIFYVLKNLDDIDAELIVDDSKILKCVRGEIHGLQLTDEGWFAKFSKYGEHGDPA